MLKLYRLARGQVTVAETPQAVREALADPDAVGWIDLHAPTAEERSLLTDPFGFHPLAIEDTAEYTERPKIEGYGMSRNQGVPLNYFLVVHGPDLETYRDRLRTKELDAFLTDRFVVTLHDEPMHSIDAMTRRMDADAEDLLALGPDRVLHTILDRLVDLYDPIFEYLETQLDDLEDQALDRPGPDLLARINDAKHDLLNLRRVIGPQRDVIAQLARGEVHLIQPTTRTYFRDVQDHLTRAVERLEMLRELVQGARDLYLTSISNDLNCVMRTLAVFSVLILPLTVVTGFFGMNFDDIPLVHSHAGFWAVTGSMMLSLIVMLLIFRKKRWL